MSSLTEVEYTAELKIRNEIIFSMEDSDISTLLDIALRRFSMDFPKLLWSNENDVVDGQELYDYPANAVKIISVRSSSGRQDIEYEIEDEGQGSGDQIRLGDISIGSTDELLEQIYYHDPAVYSNSALATGYAQYDVEYAVLQTLVTINDRSLEALSFYMEYLAYGKAATKAAQDAREEGANTPESLTDSDADGATTTIKYTTQVKLAQSYRESGANMLREYNALVVKRPYGGRG
jgi:hypothetical protein